MTKPRIPIGRPSRVLKDKKNKVRRSPLLSQSEVLISITTKDKKQLGVLYREGMTNKCSKQIQFMSNWNMAQIKNYCEKMRWKFSVLGRRSINP